MEQEIDLRKYFQVLARRWRLVRDVLIVAVLSALAFSMLGARSQSTYEARASVAILKTRSQINFDPRFRTLSGEEVGGVDLNARRNTLAALVKNPVIAQEVARELGPQLPEKWQRPEALLGAVEGGLGKGGDLIEIRVRGSDPALLVTVANSWSLAFERQINRMYATGGGSAPALQKELALSRSQYEKASGALIEFTGNNRIDELSRLVDERKKTIENLENGKQQALAQMITQMLTASVSPWTRETEGRVKALGELHATALKMERLLDDARALRNHVATGDASAGNDLALLLIKAQAFASSGDLPANLQVQLGAASGAGTVRVSDLDALIRILEGRQKDLRAAIDQQSSLLQEGSSNLSLDGEAGGTGKQPQFKSLDEVVASFASRSFPLDQTVSRLNLEMLEYQKELARQEAARDELVRARDLAWETYSTLARKVEEAAVAAQVPGTEVTFALPALRPEQPIGAVGRAQALAVATALGLLVGVFGAFAVEYFAPGSPTPALPWTAAPRWAWKRLGNGSSKVQPADRRTSLTGSPDA